MVATQYRRSLCDQQFVGRFAPLTVINHVGNISTTNGRHALSTERLSLTAADVMTGREVAALLHAPVSTVEDWARRGLLPSVKIGRRRLYVRHRIEAVLTAEPDS